MDWFCATDVILDLPRSEEFAMKNTLAAAFLVGFCLVSGATLTGQSRGPQRTQAVMGSGRADLNFTLLNLDRISQATQNDIANLRVEKWKSGWKSGFMKGSSQKEQAQQAAGSLQRNLANALPGLMRDVESSRGSISATFKLYDDVSLVCEALDSLISASEAAGKKNDAAALVDDYTAMTRVRRSLSMYIQQSAATWETRGKMPVASFSTPAAPRSRQMSSSSPQIVTTDEGVKKIIIDDTVPEKKPAPAAKKKPVTTYSNLE
jgi:hypothetical protein